MKRVLLIFDDGVHERLKEVKGSMTWENFVISRAGIGSPEELGIKDETN